MMKYFKINQLTKLFSINQRMIPLFCIVFILCFLNIYVIFSIGPHQFIDSFVHPSDYISFIKQNNGTDMYLVIQKSTHPDITKIKENTLFISTDLEIYDSTSVLSSDFSYNNTIFGKIVSIYDQNPVDYVAFSFWMYCKDHMNPYQLMQKK